MPLIVTITQTYGERITHRSEHNTNEQGVAMDEAILKAYGKGAYLHRDLGLANIGIYGQIVRDLPNNGSGWRATTLTGRVVITIEPKEE